MGSLGILEILLILVVAVLVYGKNLPQAARKAARLYGKARSYLLDVKEEINRHLPPEEDLNIRRDLEEAMEEARPDVFDPARPTLAAPETRPDSPDDSVPATDDPKPEA